MLMTHETVQVLLKLVQLKWLVIYPLLDFASTPASISTHFYKMSYDPTIQFTIRIQTELRNVIVSQPDEYIHLLNVIAIWDIYRLYFHIKWKHSNTDSLLYFALSFSHSRSPSLDRCSVLDIQRTTANAPMSKRDQHPNSNSILLMGASPIHIRMHIHTDASLPLTTHHVCMVLLSTGTVLICAPAPFSMRIPCRPCLCNVYAERQPPPLHLAAAFYCDTIWRSPFNSRNTQPLLFPLRCTFSIVGYDTLFTCMATRISMCAAFFDIRWA